MAPKPVALIERVLRRIVVDEETGCWLWQGAVGHNGYGRIGEHGREFRPHRVTYEHFIGPIPDGLTLDHLCHTNDAECFDGADCLHRRCCNPEHLEVVTIGENVRRGTARLTHCKHGHEFTPENTIQTATQRVCRECSLARARRWKDANREALNARRRAKRAQLREAA